ncbi:hypothetical protein P8C59_003372 [Phyllachora maydis]|uniref:Conserved oligomeric Golgi complex subunit 8 n=1 Tax=Phyllachora maydis TaxID=1825666 RepID=A0AAD9MCC2_9PEZI|nr:hypothetical protein P8C59_003372 [Phyllachora maydis]
MTDVLYELLVPGGGDRPSTEELDYLGGLTSQSLATLTTTEPRALAQASHANLMALQALAKRWHKSVVDSAEGHAVLGMHLPALAGAAAELRASLPQLDREAVRFSTVHHHQVDKNNKDKSEAVLLAGRRNKALLLARNVERLADLLELPTLLSSAVSASPPEHASALELNGHVRRLHGLYPGSALVGAIAAQADEAMRALAASLVLSLRAPQLKLAASIRAVGWLRRLLPDLDPGLGSVFLVCRFATLLAMLDALGPLRELADQERARQRAIGSGHAWSGGQQTERYLKRYIEIFREQTFAIVSMFRGVFAPSPRPGAEAEDDDDQDPLEPLPAALATFPLLLADLLLETLRHYLPTVKDQPARDSLLTQVLYCAGSLGRLGADFGLLLAELQVGEEWVDVVRRHRQLAGRLDSVVGLQKKT